MPINWSNGGHFERLILAAVHSDVRTRVVVVVVYFFHLPKMSKKYMDLNIFMNVEASSEYSASFKTIFAIEDHIFSF
jgi:hypothetical protein